MECNDSGFSLIKHFEGLSLTVYRDVAGLWTIGYGHRQAGSAPSTITQEQADRFLSLDISITENRLTYMLNAIPTTSDQFSAMVSLAYNIGVNAFLTSSVYRNHIAGDYANAANSFMLWDKAHVDGVLTEIPGLLRRRKAEALLYNGLSWSDV